ncbi:hypothetical protein CTAYLR_007133 [Chrysophaeum taylorii]|uniref:Ribosomal RNA-processing protein 43 n=1 Tax=Chrysophaeum taylorii TaxID=2483200 RepID=A0AAD7U832_9STRA|nr:hypothetical protein CTAYLR_007133 [Chrysophaeum taylorii]
MRHVAFNGEYVRAAAASGVRHDGRGVATAGEVEVRLIRGEGVSVAEVALQSGSRVVCSVTCGLVAPDAARPLEGRVSVSVEASVLATDGGSGGPRPHWVVEVEQLVSRLVRDCDVVDRDALCVVAGEWVWSVRCDVHILAKRGNAADAAVLAAVAALRHVRRGRVERLEDGAVRTRGLDEDPEPQGLPLLHVPLNATLAVLDLEAPVLVVDPTEAENAAALAIFCVAMTPHHRICAFQKMGGAPVEADLCLQS